MKTPNYIWTTFQVIYDKHDHAFIYILKTNFSLIKKHILCKDNMLIKTELI